MGENGEEQSLPLRHPASPQRHRDAIRTEPDGRRVIESKNRAAPDDHHVVTGIEIPPAGGRSPA
jgi:hypothetical protein